MNHDIEALFEQVKKVEAKEVNNFEESDINYPKNPYTQEGIYAPDLLIEGHRLGFNETRWLTEAEFSANSLTLKPNEQSHFITSDAILSDGTRVKDAKFYNVEQLDEASFQKLPLDVKPSPAWSLDPKIEHLIASQDVTILHNSPSTPLYNVANHTIHMPHPSQYKTTDGYYNDLFHELGHSTEKELRKEPDLSNNSSELYNQEELVAEMVAINFNQITGGNHDINSNLNYLNLYMNKLSAHEPEQIAALEQANVEADKATALICSRELNNRTKELYGMQALPQQEINNKPSNFNEAFAKARQAAVQKLEDKKSLSLQKTINKGMGKGIER